MSSATHTTTRKALADMEPQELRQWLLERQKRLITHKQFVQRYLNRRRVRRHSRQNYADRQYCQFQALADDLLELLDSVVFNVEQHTQDATSEKVSSFQEEQLPQPRPTPS